MILYTQNNRKSLGDENGRKTKIHVNAGKRGQAGYKEENIGLFF